MEDNHNSPNNDVGARDTICGGSEGSGSETGGNGNYHFIDCNVVYYDLPCSCRPTDDNCEDTAPFDVAAFLQYLNDNDIAPDFGTIDYSNVSTHYYGDDCPGGHYNDEHVPDYNN